MGRKVLNNDWKKNSDLVVWRIIPYKTAKNLNVRRSCFFSNENLTGGQGLSSSKEMNRVYYYAALEVNYREREKLPFELNYK